MKKTLALLSGIVLTLSQPSYGSQCARSNEKMALDSRALQSQLMVAALSCNQQDLYNEYILKFRSLLERQGQDMTSYFKRVYSSNANAEMNRFITNLANASSRQSLRVDDSVFCLTSASMFETILSNDPQSLLLLAGQWPIEGLHGIGVCYNK